MLTDMNFGKLVLQAEKPVILLFTAPECPSCPVTKEAVQTALYGISTVNYDYFVVDASQQNRLALMLAVRSVPTVMIYHEGKRVFCATGLNSARSFYDFKQALSSILT
jgi:thioredoxin-like negative regulator of GroEL